MARFTFPKSAGKADTDRHPVDEVLPAAPMFVYGLQHVMSMYVTQA